MFNDKMVANISNFSHTNLDESNEKNVSKLQSNFTQFLGSIHTIRSQAKPRSLTDWTDIRYVSDRTLKQREHNIMTS